MSGPAVDLTTRVAGLALDNPIVTASGCFASGREMQRFVDVGRIGAVVVKSLTAAPRQGLPTPRMVETPSGMLNAIGLQNPGVDAWLEQDLPWLVERGATTVVSIAGDSVDDFAHVARRLRGAPGVGAIEVNLSCPNVEHRGLVFALDPQASAELVRAVRRVSDVPVLAKLTADAADVATLEILEPDDMGVHCASFRAVSFLFAGTVSGQFAPCVDPDQGSARLRGETCQRGHGGAPPCRT